MPEPINFQLPEGVALRLTENDAHRVDAGGRIVLLADSVDLGPMTEAPHFLTSVTVLLNYRKDEPMEAWPETREDRVRRRFRLSIEEIPADEAAQIVEASLQRRR